MVEDVQRFGFNLGLRKLATERSFFDPRLPFAQPPGERWEALFDQYKTSFRNAALLAAGGSALGLVAAKLAKLPPVLQALGLAAGGIGGFAGGGHLTYESMRDTIPPTKQELKEQDPIYGAKRLFNYVRSMNRSFGQ